MRKVTHVITTISRGGAENQLLVLVREQLAVNNAVRVIYLKDEPELIKEFIDLGVTVNSPKSKFVFLQLLWLRKNLFKNQEIVHAHLPRAELMVALISGNHRFIVSRHNAEKFFPKAPSYISKKLSRYVTKKSFEVIAISNSVRDYLIQEKEICPRVDIVVVHYGYDSSLHSNIDKVFVDNLREKYKNAFIIGTVARLVPQKDYPTLFRAFVLFAENEPNSYLFVIGDGFLLVELKTLAFRLGILEKIIWFGKVNNPIDFISSFDLFVLASVYEGFGLVILESFIAKTPVIASANSAVLEVLGEESTSLFPIGDFKALAAKMMEFKDKEMRIKLVKMGEDRLKNFNASVMIQSMEKEYSKF